MLACTGTGMPACSDHSQGGKKQFKQLRSEVAAFAAAVSYVWRRLLDSCVPLLSNSCMASHTGDLWSIIQKKLTCSEIHYPVEIHVSFGMFPFLPSVTYQLSQRSELKNVLLLSFHCASCLGDCWYKKTGKSSMVEFADVHGVFYFLV